MKYINKLTLGFLAILCILSCSKEDSGVANKADIRIQLGMGGETTSSQSNDPQIKTVRIMVFDANGFIDVNKLFDNSESTFHVSTRVGKGKKVAVVANETSELKDELNRLLTIKEFNRVRQSNYSPLTPMLSGVTDNVDVNPQVNNSCKVSLIRAYANIQIDISKKNPHDEIYIKSIKLINMSQTSPLNPQGEEKSSDLFDITKTFAENTRIDIKDTYFTSNIYEQKGNVAVSDKRPTLQVVATFNGVEAKYTSVISNTSGENTNDANTDSQILRNRKYLINATISKLGEFDGMFVKTEILPWNKKSDNQEITLPSIAQLSLDEAGKQPINFDETYKINPRVPFEFWVKIHSDIPQNWTASVTNGLYFTVTPSSGEVNKDKAVKVTVNSTVYNLYTPIKFELFFNVGKYAVAQSPADLKIASIKLEQLAR